MTTPNPGQLHVVATPIGNLEDIGRRAMRILAEAAAIACEDTRRCRGLLAHLDIAHKQLIALHDHNEQSASTHILTLLRQGASVALVCDAGTPLLSDPGFDLVRRARGENIRVVPIPGPSAITAAISASPIPINRFLFEGFLPAKPTARRRVLSRMIAADHATVFFEAPHRLHHALTDLASLGGGERRLAIFRELTKLHEEILVAPVQRFLAEDAPTLRGEFVCILEGASSKQAATPESDAAISLGIDRILTVLGDELPTPKAAKLAAKLTGLPRAELYERLASRLGDD